jgi:hypothetical protein
MSTWEDSPVNPRTEFLKVTYGEVREEFEPVLRIGKEVDLLDRDANRLHDLELVLHFDGLGRRLSFLCCELGWVISRRGRCSWLHLNNRLVILVILKVTAKHSNLIHKLIGTGTYRHSGTVEAHGEEDFLALHSCKTCGEFDLGQGESMAYMKSSVHVGVSHRSEAGNV